MLKITKICAENKKKKVKTKMKFINSHGTSNFSPVDLATDDWPFFYLDGRKMPPEYRIALEAMELIDVEILGMQFGELSIADHTVLREG